MVETIEEKLKYIGLDLNDIPEFLKKFEPLDFRPSKIKEDNKHIVYKYIPIDKIQIFITPKNRLESIEDKYAKAAPISAYLEPDTQDNIERHIKFLSMLKQVTIDEIEQAMEEQKLLIKNIPFNVKYYKSYAWQIYYSESANQYFMMLPSEDAEYDKLFLLLKMQIEFNKSKSKKTPQIFAPINYMDYSEMILKKSEINDIENYLWLFTKDWPNIYEVYDKNNDISIQIVGETEVYEGIKSKYRIKLSSKEEAIEFYQYIKALFILQTELAAHYKFKTKVNFKNELEFEYNGTKIKYENLSKFIEDEYIALKKNDIEQDKEIINQKKKLDELKNTEKTKENEYLDKQRQIALYLECKKTFFGKVKYFFKRKKSNAKTIDNNSLVSSPIVTDATEILKNSTESKTYYTIEDLVTLHYKTDKKDRELTNINMDIEALKNKINNLDQKVKNATLYIEEIDNHKKSIFEFWKFANKDELKALEVGSADNGNSSKHIKKVFRYEFDFDDFSIRMDNLQRVRLSKEEQDSAFITTTELIDVINNEELLESSLDNLKNIQENESKVYNFQNFDIFGNMQDSRAKTKNLGNQKHRENKKDKLKILGITKNTTLEEYKNKINSVRNNLNDSLKKIKSQYDMSIYIVADKENILENEYGKYYINLESALRNANSNEKEIKVYKINLKEDMPLICCTNIIFYDNFNKTLPEGMNEEKSVIIKNSMYYSELISKDEFRTNMYISEIEENPLARKITVYEYNMNLK